MNKLFLAAIKEETIGLDYFNHTGVGKINATYNTLKLINIYEPKIIINYGTGGAVNNQLKGIVECTKFYQRDMDVRGLGFKLGETPFDKIKEIIISQNGHSCGTGDSFVNKKIDMKVDVVDMEAYAIAKVCMLENIEFRCFKYISDNADENANIDWNKNLILGANAFSKFINDNSL
ncbi:5'-methylthioadenosine/S-adenosylhomocysteine nucleosidase [Candidatus Pelagibacter sp. Uisw_092]|uniref:5'-methylthioadenosine/S-adenosylhomocysteine nucleosidase family protein n=1 Tax=Candidatus Pelagibacter sp. Uisw_092 TaxID=3230979 RepID=UPI0039EC746A